MTLHCPHCNALHELTRTGEQLCAACGKEFEVDRIPVYEDLREHGPELNPLGEEVSLADGSFRER